MAILINAHQISKSFGTKRLFKELSFSIHDGERIGLIGPNGAGKSTLLKMIYAESDTESAAHPDSGELSFKNGIRIGFLDQVPSFKPDATILTAVLNPKDLEDWEKLNLAREFISRFELDRWEDDTKVSSLSGGWQKRLALIRELVKQPDLLLLDEPTNHLDIESILLLENFLARSPFATLTITHDRAFLQNVANRIIEINPRHEGGMLSVNGDYVQFLETREQLLHSQERAETVLKNTLRRETEWLRRGAKARTTKQQARIQRHGELSETVEDLNARNQTKKARIDFISTEKSPKKLVEVVNLGKTFGNKEIFSGINLILNPGTRLGLLGPNGIGKSTFINVLLGIEKPTTGTVTLAENLKISYFDQSRRSLDPLLTVKETVCPTGDHVQFQGNSVHIRSYLDRFLFTHAQTDMKVGSLSGGEQARLLIARLMLQPANLLVLDEPTNDLDLETMGVLEDCLTSFEGTVIIVAHDRFFLDQVATKLLAFSPRLKTPIFFESFEQWERWHMDVPSAKSVAKAEAKAAAVIPEKKRKLTFKEQHELKGIEETIHKAEAEVAKLTEQTMDPKILSNAVRLTELTKELGAKQNEVEKLYARWNELEELSKP